MVGKPLKYKTPKDLQKVIDQYFDKTPNEQYSISGLALAVGSRQLLGDYEKRKEYTSVVRRARLIVENSYELALRTKNCTGAIFALKNMGWKDKTETELTGKGIQIAVLNYSPNAQGEIEQDTDTNKELPAP